jgi:transcriptional regulator with XRE-family HTH domain
MRDSRPLGEFLRSRRERLRPEEAGIRTYGVRRVPGLRREELALLAGVSPTYYGRLEQGQGHQVSASVLDGLAAALRLTVDERAHLHALARPAPPPGPVATPAGRRGVRQLVEAVGVPAIVVDASSDVLAWNTAGRLLVAPHLAAAAPEHPVRPNLTRMLFLDPTHRAMQPRWATAAACAVAALRVAAGRRPHDRGLHRLIAALRAESAEFAALWTEHPVAEHDSGPRRLRHPELGDVVLDLESLRLADGSGHRVMMYSAPPGSSAHAALARLGVRRVPGSPS